jgi:hypothetical protein
MKDFDWFYGVPMTASNTKISGYTGYGTKVFGISGTAINLVPTQIRGLMFRTQMMCEK